MNIPINEIISGERFESLCDYSFDILNYMTGDHGRPKYNGSDKDLITNQINHINNISAKVIFVYGHDIPIFLENIHRINTPFKMVSHNSDLGIFEQFKPAISDKIIEWYGQNNYIEHDRVFSLPIGIANSKYMHGNLATLHETMKNITKTNLVYKNFDICTNFYERMIADQATSRNNIHMSPKTTVDNYWRQLSNAIYAISPHGNGVDCHRIWECLYFKTVPIVTTHIAYNQFKHLPIMIIDSWETVTIDYLKSNVNNWDDRPVDMLTLSYWKNRIRG